MSAMSATPYIYDAPPDIEERPELWAGYRRHSRARSTGALIVLVDGWAQGLSTPSESVRNEAGDLGDGRWFLICDAHDQILSDRSQANLRPFMSAPEEWCSECRESQEAAV